MIGVVVLVGTLVVATVAGLVLRARNGQLRSRRGSAGSATGAGIVPGAEPAAESGIESGAEGLDLRPFGAEPGARATLLQFSSAFCAPCRATRTMLSEVAGVVPGVRHVEIDVADGDAAMDLVRRLDIRRTPTTLVLDSQAREVRRASGVPRRDQVLTALTALPEAASALRDDGASDVGV